MGEVKDFVTLYIEDSDMLETFTHEVAMNLENNIKDEAPYKEGRLKRSIRTDTRIHKMMSIITGYWDEGVAPHGIYVLAGTKPHTIRPKGQGRYHAGQQLTQGSALWWPGAEHPVREVHHPGTKPNDFLGRGLDRTVAMYR